MKSDEFWRSNDCKGTSLGVPTHHFEVFFNETTHLGPRLVGLPKRWQVISPGSQMSCVQKKIQTQRIFRNAVQRVNPALNDLDGFVLVLLAYLHVRCLKLLKSSSDLTYPAKKKKIYINPLVCCPSMPQNHPSNNMRRRSFPCSRNPSPKGDLFSKHGQKFRTYCQVILYLS